SAFGVSPTWSIDGDKRRPAPPALATSLRRYYFFGCRPPRGPALVEFDDAYDVDRADDDRSGDHRRQVARLKMHHGVKPANRQIKAPDADRHAGFAGPAFAQEADRRDDEKRAKYEDRGRHGEPVGEDGGDHPPIAG